MWLVLGVSCSRARWGCRVESGVLDCGWWRRGIRAGNEAVADGTCFYGCLGCFFGGQDGEEGVRDRVCRVVLEGFVLVLMVGI